MGNYNSGQAHLQQEVTAWIWDRLWNGGGAEGIGDALNTPTWSEFDVRAPGGAMATVRIEVKS